MALAEKYPVEIVSVDSAQVYRGMDIGTAKPPAAERARVPHHLIDLVDPDQRYSAGRFRTDAIQAVGAILSRNRLPLLVGGTMLYFQALTAGLSELPQADPAIRLVIDTMARDSGWPALHAELARVDPETAARLKPSDAQRIQRALEVYYIAERPLSALTRQPRQVYFPYTPTRIALVPGDRGALHERIAQRFEVMLEHGLIDEVRQLRRRYALDTAMPSMRCVGYRQVWQHLDGEFGLAGLREKGIAATRQLAKRQLTWLRAMEEVTTFDCLADDLADRVLAFLRSKLEISAAV